METLGASTAVEQEPHAEHAGVQKVSKAAPKGGRTMETLDASTAVEQEWHAKHAGVQKVSKAAPKGGRRLPPRKKK